MKKTFHNLMSVILCNSVKKRDEIKFSSSFFSQTRIARLGLAVAIALSGWSCSNSEQISTRQISSRPDNELILAHASLEQTDAAGEILWKLSAETVEYSQDRKNAEIGAIAGKIWHNGEVVLEVSAERGKIDQETEEIWLHDNIVVVDPRNQITLKADIARWQVATATLTIPQPLEATHPQLQITALQARYQPQNQRLQLQGEVVATGLEPALQLKTEEIVWHIAAQRLNLPESLQLARYQDDKVSDLVVANKGQVNLADNLAIFEQNVQLTSLQPKLQIASHNLSWNYQKRWASTNQPIKIVQPEKLTITANAGMLDWPSQTAKLSDGVRGSSSSNQNQLYSNQLTWQIDSGLVEAQGNVIYHQNDPKMDLTGHQAVGKLQDQSIRVSSSESKPVETTIYTLPLDEY